MTLQQLSAAGNYSNLSAAADRERRDSYRRGGEGEAPSEQTGAARSIGVLDDRPDG